MRILYWLSGFLVAIGLMVFDEILSLAIYCHDCKYPIPLLGAWSLYDAEGFAWILILLGISIVVVETVKSPERKGGDD